MGVRIGGGCGEITPALGTPFGGFAIERTARAMAVHDPLLATATLITNEEDAIVLISCDLQVISPDAVARARAAIHARWGIPAAHVLIAATHVHSAPGGDASERQISGVDPYFTTPEATERIHAGILAAVDKAHAALRLATLHGVFSEISGIGRSRHAPERDISASVCLLVAMDDVMSQPIAAIANYGCHASILGPDNTSFSADYPGVVRRELSRRLGGVPVSFLNAPAGDISTRATRRATSFAEVERLGGMLADQIHHTLGAPTPIQAAPLTGAITTIAVPVDTTLLPRLIAASEAFSGPDDIGARRRAFQIERLRALRDPTIPCEIQAIRCGDIAFVGIAAELFGEPARALAAMSPAAHTVLIAPANGTIGNIPPPALHAEVHPIVTPLAASIIQSAATALCDDLFGRATGRPS